MNKTYGEVKKERKETTKKASGGSPVGKWLFGLGIFLIVTGFFTGLWWLGEAGDTYDDTEKAALQLQALIYFASGVLGGSLFMGIGETVKLLHDINQNIKD